jgi:hypothetical protein
MGRSLDELVEVGYLSKWDIKPMSTKEGYKLVLLPGRELLHVLAISHRKQVTEGENAAWSEVQQQAVQALSERGVSAAKAGALIQEHDPELIVDQIEYAEHLILSGKKRKIENPAGFIIYAIENSLSVPTGFVTTRRRLEKEQRARTQMEQEARLAEQREEYESWRDAQVEQELGRRYPGAELKKKIKEIVKLRVRMDDSFRRMLPPHQEALAGQFLRQETREGLEAPTFEQWSEQRRQQNMF